MKFVLFLLFLFFCNAMEEQNDLEERPLRSEGLKWKELKTIVIDKNMFGLMTIDPNAKTDDGAQATILHWCTRFAWVEGVKYLMSREPKPDLTIYTAGSNGCNKFAQVFVQSVLDSYYRIQSVQAICGHSLFPFSEKWFHNLSNVLHGFDSNCTGNP